MKGNDPRYSRVNRKKMRNKSNQLLNIMIGLVVVLILIVGASIIIGNNDDDGKESASEEKVLDDAGSSTDEPQDEEDDSVSDSKEDKGSSEASDEESDGGEQSSTPSENAGGSDSNDEVEDKEEPGKVTIVPDNDEIIMETVINPGWQPIGTVQTGVHESKYDGESVDWNEKKKAISYATGHSEEELIFWKIKNGGGPQKAIGIASTRDKSKKYRVYLEWVDEKGWQPVQMDILNTLDFEY